MTRKRLGGIVWTARRRDGTPYLSVRWLGEPGGPAGAMEIWRATGNGRCVWIGVHKRDVRRLMRLMQKALDYRYGKRASKKRSKQ